MIPTAGLVLGDRYELQSRIAIGGMGEVWVALDRHLRRRVAAKVLRAEFAGEKTFLDRLRAEARNSAALSHQNIAAMYDYGEQNGSGYLIMELVQGEPLAELLERERTLEPAQLLPVLAQTARALHTAHMAGVVHRDVKPSNILITPDGYVKITDFGISLGSNQAPMTAAGMVMGTAQYLPPEQAMGRAATGAGDIYALGVVAYEALVGKRPFTGGSQVDIAFAHVNQPVPALPDTVDARVRDVVMAMLEKDPEQRPRSAASLARSLEELAGHLDVTIEPAADRPATLITEPDGDRSPRSGALTQVWFAEEARPDGVAVDAPAGDAAVAATGTAERADDAHDHHPEGDCRDGDHPNGDDRGGDGSADGDDRGGSDNTAHTDEASDDDSGDDEHGDGTDEPPTRPRWRPLSQVDPAAPTTPPTPLPAISGAGPAAVAGPVPTRRTLRTERTERTAVTRPAVGVHRERLGAAHAAGGFIAWVRSGWWWAAGIVAMAAVLTVVALWLGRLWEADASMAIASPLLAAALHRPVPDQRVKER
ncbi:serine/threonine-protein kinase [Occultella gossypii]|uniref:non-specific serine/threonine protein kinase n=1 Tax=Occultella gossypii TaxID=2800820 RepID=A0ABS7SAS0_9MICO|nr:serine/threonine-protein kinase [Occultella gossypii]MBZ2196978.1 serine/threonine protein kinase [Occultella gossypii]